MLHLHHAAFLGTAAIAAVIFTSLAVAAPKAPSEPTKGEMPKAAQLPTKEPTAAKGGADGPTRVILSIHRSNLHTALVRVAGTTTQLILGGNSVTPPRLQTNLDASTTYTPVDIRLTGRGAIGETLRHCQSIAATLLATSPEFRQFDLILDYAAPARDRFDGPTVSASLPADTAITCGLSPSTLTSIR